MKNFFSLFFVAILVLVSCRKDHASEPLPVISYIINDTMHLSEFAKTNYPETYNNYYNKTFHRETNKVLANYQVDGPDVIITFGDTSVINLGTDLILKISNKNLSNISGNYSSLTSDIYYKWHQTLSSNSALFSVDWAKADSCNMQLSYDAGTRTLSGTLTNLKYTFGVYVPYYVAGSAITPHTLDGELLKAGGSFRKHNIQFLYVKPK